MKIVKLACLFFMFAMSTGFSATVFANEDTDAQSRYFYPMDYDCGDDTL